MGTVGSRCAAVLICTLGLAATVARAQEAINYASVSGRVIDQQGAVVAGAQITARQIETNGTAQALTGADGRFRLPYLKVGPYEVTIHRDGFADSTAR